MDAHMTARFERVEKALATLIDSISRYNPTLAQGSELITAEQELSRGFDQLKVHQQNQARIQRLRTLTTGLDRQIKDTLTQLAHARKELINTPATTFPAGPNYPIKYDELLAYARRISKTTLPNANVLASAHPSAVESTTKPDSGADTPAAAATPAAAGTPNGVGTPMATAAQVNGTTSAGGSAVGTPAAVNGGDFTISTTNGNGQQANSNNNNSSTTTLPEGLQAHINPSAGADFIPWPNEDLLRQGALANIQYLTDKGIEPKGHDPAAEEAQKKREEEEVKEREEKERLEREEKERRHREQRDRARAEEEKAWEEAARRASVSQAGAAATESGPNALQQQPPPTTTTTTTTSSTAQPQQQQPKQFQFMGADDDDDDSD
ncbi:vitamin-D-receptor interacting mediator subunit 4-domain-containing protein [Truncatella angustata]|uniref:Mediator of RNA polymerase II transcription subunit 4 n=1 Tax=Truncatella angustata TaxID=152316 RepID=A0A9P8UVQ2_9PEZI|nr:vitamin-D-receptor interacting mediator subunit 4-domain-containing protein [Truncatella angustata]KAH6659092.1 vitamin-D-receptor interacting mediator subunit 4-domain-containing protein [Truncatella angustata]KAH8201239.1 hypothetical protein TruAng_004629 [Truncatella angustata]